MLALASSKASASAVASCYFVLPASRVLLEPPLSLRSATLASKDISSLQMYSMMYIALPQSTCIQICNNRLLSRTYLICTSMCTVYALPMYCVSVNQYISSRTSVNVATCYLYRCHIITEYPTLQYWDNLKKEMRHTSLPYIVCRLRPKGPALGRAWHKAKDQEVNSAIKETVLWYWREAKVVPIDGDSFKDTLLELIFCNVFSVPSY